MSKSSYKIAIYPSKVAIVKYSGSLDPMIVQKAVEECLIRDCIYLVIDLNEVSYAPSAAVGAFIGLRTTMQKKGGILTFAAPPQQIQIVLDMMGFRELFTFYDNAEEGLRALVSAHKDDSSEKYTL